MPITPTRMSRRVERPCGSSAVTAIWALPGRAAKMRSVVPASVAVATSGLVDAAEYVRASPSGSRKSAARSSSAWPPTSSSTISGCATTSGARLPAGLLGRGVALAVGDGSPGSPLNQAEDADFVDHAFAQAVDAGGERAGGDAERSAGARGTGGRHFDQAVEAPFAADRAPLHPVAVRAGGMRTSSPPGSSCRPRTPAPAPGPAQRRRPRPARRTPPSRRRSRRPLRRAAASPLPWRRRRPVRRGP